MQRRTQINLFPHVGGLLPTAAITGYINSSTGHSKINLDKPIKTGNNDLDKVIEENKQQIEEYDELKFKSEENLKQLLQQRQKEENQKRQIIQQSEELKNVNSKPTSTADRMIDIKEDNIAEIEDAATDILTTLKDLNRKKAEQKAEILRIEGESKRAQIKSQFEEQKN